MRNVFCIGELLIDFVCRNSNVSLVDGTDFEKKAGGAPANVAAAITKLGGRATFMGQVGNDPSGEFLEQTLQRAHVDTSMLIRDKQTTLAFVSIDKDGERDFIFMRGADGEYTFNKIDLSKIKRNDLIHFGSATALLSSPLKETYFQLLQFAKDNNHFISFDPNYRDALITDVEQFSQDCLSFIKHAHFVKVSQEEAIMLSKETDLQQSALKLLHYGAKVVAITLGKDGTLLATKDSQIIVPSVSIKQVDTTGAGDAFVGAMLYQISKNEQMLPQKFTDLTEFVSFANKVGAITCTNYGAISSLPSLADVKAYD
ncbi:MULTISPECIES: carbohydrate kinase family protein [Bacillus]|uniref:carbohydrate kinase family protein n=1 Tax=Bacillus TaxID=1386 RepID=UPI000469A551|nr:MULTISPECIES: carbohydrate kinase [Bacillus]MED1412239.1 carbohydrate kinase [Bacillus paramycoides]MED1463719.1 carbohydrate kinase [Bacillus paramycoides]MED1494346.1 carbohydrate kinase [Bacillus paramycoides]